MSNDESAKIYPIEDGGIGGTWQGVFPEPMVFDEGFSITLQSDDPNTALFFREVFEQHERAAKSGAFHCPHCDTDGLIWHYCTKPITVSCDNCTAYGVALSVEGQNVLVSWVRGYST
jgi:hypothetical protein